MRTADGALVTVATFLGPVRYVLHDGSADPGPAASGLVRAGPAVTGAERSPLLAAFNGGFKLSAGAGGYMQEGHMISPLRPGFASLVIDRSGQARIGVWGRGLPAPGEAVYSVRQNLQPLVLNGRPTAASADWTLWGATLGGGAYVARSAIGQGAAGDLMYAASMSAVPADLAAALAGHGARIAMELDINPEWVQLDAAGIPGGALTAEIPGQYRPAGQYLAGWTRDFLHRPGSARQYSGHPAACCPHQAVTRTPFWLHPRDAVLRAGSRRCPGSGGGPRGAGPARGRAGRRPAWRQDRRGGLYGRAA